MFEQYYYYKYAARWHYPYVLYKTEDLAAVFFSRKRREKETPCIFNIIGMRIVVMTAINIIKC